MVLMVRTERLTRRFKEFTAVDSLDLDVNEGEVYGLLGPNGAGKTTTIKMLTTLLPPTSGTASLAGYDVVHEGKGVKASMGYIPQMLSADGNLTGYENLLVFSKLYDVPRKERASRIEESMRFMGVWDVKDRMVRHYSGGMIRRLEIAQSLLHRPKIILMDEPTQGLDPVARAAVWGHLKRLRAEYHMTVLLTTHLMDEAENLCDRIGIMNRGKMVTEGTPAEIVERSGCENLDQAFAHFVGESLDQEGDFSSIRQARKTARRLG
ncbi:MAG: ATP-binding cassette domain-containing protein [Methanomassiliicoccales archaeon]|jgi:ABC-2 type transport system ATP-binding protein